MSEQGGKDIELLEVMKKFDIGSDRTLRRYFKYAGIPPRRKTLNETLLKKLEDFIRGTRKIGLSQQKYYREITQKKITLDEYLKGEIKDELRPEDSSTENQSESSGDSKGTPNPDPTSSPE